MGNRRKALVTGSSRGIAAAIAKRLALDGVEIVVHGNQNPAAAETVVKEITAVGGKSRWNTGQVISANGGQLASATLLRSL